MSVALCVSSKIHAFRPDGSPVPFAEALALARKAGFTQMDYGFSSAALLREDWEEAAMMDYHAAQESGVTFRYAHLPYDYPKTSDGWANFFIASCRAIDLAVRFGVECAAIHPCTFMTKCYNYDLMRSNALEFLRPYCEYAKKAGLTLALENMRGAGKNADPMIKRYVTQVEDLWDLAQTLDIGICWDTGHGNISAQLQYESLKLIAPRLKMLHINDNYAEDDIHLAPFLGTINWNDVAKALREIGFDGAINLEVTCSKRPLELRDAYVAYMGKAAALLRTMIES